MPKSTPKKIKPFWPRPYLSWSQLDCFEHSPMEYIKRYIYGESKSTPAMEFGKRMAEMLEHDTEQEDEELEFYRTFLPRYEKHEHEIRTEFAGVPLLGKLDGFNEDGLVIGEYKTGREWTAEKVRKHRQLDFYAMLVYKKYGKLPSKIMLHWIPTEINGSGKLGATGEIKQFETIRTMAQVFKIAADAKRAWDEIGRICAEEHKSIGI